MTPAPQGAPVHGVGAPGQIEWVTLTWAASK
jgi:hypothetical protein